MITTRAILHALLALLLTLSPSLLTSQARWQLSLTSALPITSKPIESTAENLAWQAWLMLPPEQKSLEKSRKVTPKSIFTLPFRECPPGHQLFENRCIPTVNIDPTALLHQQLLELVVGDGSANNNYENYDYDDEELIMYDNTPQKFSGGFNLGGSGSSSYDDASQLPSQDEPLKFNIFEQKFPTDYETDMAASYEGGSEPSQLPNVSQDNRTNILLHGTEFLDAVKGFLQRHSNETTNTNKYNSNITATTTSDRNNTANSSNSETDTNLNNFADLQSESSNVSTKFVVSSGYATTTAASTTSTKSSEHTFSVSEIDAIALPAVPPGHAADLESLRPHKFSLFKDDSAIQLVTTVISQRTNDETSQPDMAQLLKADALLPLGGAVNRNGATTPTTKTTILRDAAAIATTPLTVRGGSADDEVTSMTTIDADAEATTLTDLSELLAADEPILESEPEKDEHIRSVTMRSSSLEEDADLLGVQEEEFTTTLEPDATTNFQLDETTIIEAHDPPAIVLQELKAAAAAQQHSREQALKQSGDDRQRENHHVVLKKSKVEPVELVVGMTATTTTTSTTTTEFPTTTKATSTSTPLPTVSQSVGVTTAMATQDDRFYYQHLGGVGGAEDRNQQQQQQMRIADGKYVGNDDDRSGSTTTTTSEINIEQELRMINELVKGKHRQLATAKTITTPATRSTTTTASTITSTSESGFTTETVETEATGDETATSASNNKETVEAAVDVAPATQSSLTTVESSDIDAGSISATKTANTLATITTAATTTTSTEPTTTLWSKIMPILGFGSATSTATTETDKTTSSTTASEPAESLKAEAEDQHTSISSSSSISINSNRSNRNSKISRINNQSANSISESTNVAIAEPSTTATTLTAVATISETTTENSESQAGGDYEPFWWLPVGWRLDRNANDEEQSLLLRFWSAFPGNQAKVKK